MRKKAYLFYPVLLLSISLLLFACGGSDTATVTTGTTVPTAPASFIANATSFSWTKIDLSWAASTDDVAVEGYKIYNGTGGWIDNSVGTSYTVTGLVNGTEYCYTVSAYDADGNESDPTGETCATTQLGANLIEIANAGHADHPQIAVDGGGNAIAVWAQSDGANYNIYANAYNGTAWGAAGLIETEDLGEALNPQVAFEPTGNAIAVWHQYDGTSYNIWANTYNGTAWETAEKIETTLRSAYFPEVAMDGSGKAVAVWYQDDIGGYNIWANTYNGTGWEIAGLIETNPGSADVPPQIAMDASGKAVAVWNQHNGLVYDIWANIYNGTGWGIANLIEAGAGNAIYPQIAMDASGKAIAVWQQRVDAIENIYANMYNGTGWGTAELIEADDTVHAQYPQVAFDRSGNAVAVWQHGTVGFNIWANIYNGTGWGIANLIETDDVGDAYSAQVAMDGSGNAVAVWQQRDATTKFNIYANRYTLGTGWGTATLIETDNAGDALNPQIAMDGSGNALTVWRQNDGAMYNIWANIFR